MLIRTGRNSSASFAKKGHTPLQDRLGMPRFLRNGSCQAECACPFTLSVVSTGRTRRLGETGANRSGGAPPITNVTLLPGRLTRSDTSLNGREALDLYRAQLGREAIKMIEQSTLLLAALAEHLVLLHEIETGKAAIAVAGKHASKSQR